MFVGQLDRVFSQQMLVFTTLINASSCRNWDMGKGFENDLPKENVLACSLRESCEAATKVVGLAGPHSVQGGISETQIQAWQHDPTQASAPFPFQFIYVNELLKNLLPLDCKLSGSPGQPCSWLHL